MPFRTGTTHVWFSGNQSHSKCTLNSMMWVGGAMVLTSKARVGYPVSSDNLRGLHNGHVSPEGLRQM